MPGYLVPFVHSLMSAHPQSIGSFIVTGSPYCGSGEAFWREPMSALRRHIIRHGRHSLIDPPHHRGVRGQHARHIIKRGIRHAKMLKVGNLTRYIPGLFAVELHATKGWRNVPAWS